MLKLRSFIQLRINTIFIFSRMNIKEIIQCLNLCLNNRVCIELPFTTRSNKKLAYICSFCF